MIHNVGAYLLVPSRTTTATETIDIHNPGAVPGVFHSMKCWIGCRFTLRATAVASDSGDNLDIFLQTGFRRKDGVEHWDDFLKFTQVGGDETAPVEVIAVWQRGGQTPESELHADADAALSAGVMQGQISELLRVNTVVTNTGGNQSFTYEIWAEPVEEL